jgi:hypothetical protein
VTDTAPALTGSDRRQRLTSRAVLTFCTVMAILDLIDLYLSPPRPLGEL